jgi:hypothetical protein
MRVGVEHFISSPRIVNLFSLMKAPYLTKLLATNIKINEFNPRAGTVTPAILFSFQTFW